MVSSIAYQYEQRMFDKPLNPVLGETYVAKGADGSIIYMEQTSHHPPRSHYYIDGPNNNYKIHGYQDFKVNAWPNQAQIEINGLRTTIF